MTVTLPAEIASTSASASSQIVSAIEKLVNGKFKVVRVTGEDGKGIENHLTRYMHSLRKTCAALARCVGLAIDS